MLVMASVALSSGNGNGNGNGGGRPSVEPGDLMAGLPTDYGEHASTAPLTMLNQSKHPLARCLDGSPFGVYVRPAPANASIASRNGWLVVLNGGGLCTHSEDCLKRSKTQLGTSTVWPSTFPLDTVAFLSSDPRNQFRDWNLAFVPYCSGDMHAGQRTSATNATFGLTFAGFHNVMATISHLSTAHAVRRSSRS